jgi:predicted ribosome quality control (RQC) complex YloA/Tae2 family protein
MRAQVLVGRNHTENDRLSHEVAAKGDLWFHARGCAGSHVVLRIPPGRCASHALVQSQESAAPS